MVIMGVYNKDNDELEDHGDYDTEEEARADFENYDKPKNHYALLDDGTRWD